MTIHGKTPVNLSLDIWMADGLRQLSVQLDTPMSEIVHAALLEKHPQLSDLRKGFIGRVLSPRGAKVSP